MTTAIDAARSHYQLTLMNFLALPVTASAAEYEAARDAKDRAEAEIERLIAASRVG